MKRISILLTLFAFLFVLSSWAQDIRSSSPLEDGTIEQQLEYLIDKSSRWETYKVVQESWLTKFRKNALDTLAQKNQHVFMLNDSIEKITSEIKSLNFKLAEVNKELLTAQKERDSFKFMGIIMSKGFFSSLFILVIVVALFISAAMFLLMQRSNISAFKIKKQLETTNEEFERYRHETRIKQETMVIQHHKEIQKLKGIS